MGDRRVLVLRKLLHPEFHGLIRVVLPAKRIVEGEGLVLLLLEPGGAVHGERAGSFSAVSESESEVVRFSKRKKT